MTSSTHRILIFDDDILSCKLLQKVLIKEGYQAEYVTNYENFTLKMSKEWDLLMLDLNIPDRDGFSILNELKKNKQLNLPVIILTADTDERTLELCFNAGANDFLSKPFSKKVLLARISHSINLFDQMNGYKRNSIEILNEIKKFVPHDLLGSIYEGKYKSGSFLKREYTIMFADIIGYTKITEHIHPNDLCDIMDRLYRIMEECVSSSDGLVNEFIGDACLAIFSGNAAADNALNAAKLLHHKLDQYNLLEKTVGLAPIQLGIGIHTGEIMIGSIGTQKKVTLTILGDAVNVAARIEQLTRRFSAKTLFSGETFKKLNVQSKDIRIIEKLKVKGREEELELYEIFESDPIHIRQQKSQSISVIKNAVELYHGKNYKEAIKKFSECSEIFPSDSVVYEYIKRCYYFIKHPAKKITANNLNDESYLDWNYRRRFNRIKISSEVEFVSGYKENRQSSIKGKVINISLQGACISIMGYARINDSVLLKLKSDFFENEIKFIARIKWIEKVNEETLLGLETQVLNYNDQDKYEELIINKQNHSDNDVSILILDDDLKLCKQLRSTFNMQGLKASYITHSNQIIEKLDNFDFKIILLDLFMPEIDGFKVLKMLKLHSKYSKIPVIVMTSDTMDEKLINRCFEYGANDFVTKPISIKPLLARVNASIGMAGELVGKSEELLESNKKLTSMLIQVEEESANKSLMLKTMSHELRTPLNGIIASIDLVKDFKTNFTTEEIKVLDLMKRSGKRLNNTVISILDFLNLDNKEIKALTQEIRLESLINHVLNNIQQKYDSKNLGFEVIKSELFPEIVYGDGTRLTQVLSVILDNAFKFTLEGKVTLKINVTKKGLYAFIFYFEIQDTGVGFEKEMTEKLFESFVQQDQSLTRSFEGSGLGLSIAKRYCELLNTKLEYESTKNVGSRFWFNVELLNHEPEKEIIEDKPIEPSEKLKDGNVNQKILLVEDNEDNIELVEILLKKQNWDITVAYNGIEALEKYPHVNWDIILMDIHMPKMDGITATKKIRELEKEHRKRTPIIALTALAQEQDKANCMQAGMDDYLTKPVKKKILLEVIRKWINGN